MPILVANTRSIWWYRTRFTGQQRHQYYW